MKWIHYALIVSSWLTVPLIGKKSFLRYLPSATFISLLFALESEYAVTNKWWKIKGKIVKDIPTAMSFVLGPFLIGAIWALKLSYGRFSLYLFVNIIMDSIFCYVLSPLLEKLRVYKLIKYTRTVMFWNFILYALLMYGYQMIVEKGFSSKGVSNVRS